MVNNPDTHWHLSDHRRFKSPMSLTRIAAVFNGFIHDFATGYWLASLIALRLLHGFQQQYTEVADLLGMIEKFFFWNSIGAVVIILATGAGRTFTYVDNAYGEATESTRRKMLLIKHIILLALFGAGGWWGYSMTFLPH